MNGLVNRVGEQTPIIIVVGLSTVLVPNPSVDIIGGAMLGRDHCRTYFDQSRRGAIQCRL
jgi:hypothetical protein